MKAIELIKISSESMKVMSEIGIKTEERFSRIEGSVEEMKEMMRKLIEAQNK